MASVTQRIKSIRQPYGGYLPIKSFNKKILDDGILLNAEENIHSSLVGMAVDYLTRFLLGNSVEKAFHISTLGAMKIGMTSKATMLKAKISGLDNESIIAACKLSGFDVCYRSSVSGYKPIENISPDIPTIENIRTMVTRSLSFWKRYGPIIHSEPTFEGGYSNIVTTGDGDFVTKDTLWDFKVSKSPPTSQHTLQILIYYIMGLHSVHSYFNNITHLGFFNPRLNTIYICPVSLISKETIKEIEENVICYNAFNFNFAKQNQNNIQNSNSPTFSSTEYSVSDICQTTGQKKNSVYSDIRSGKLYASKKGNKYVISEIEFNRYVEHIKMQQKMLLLIPLALGMLVLFWFFFNLFCGQCFY